MERATMKYSKDELYNIFFNDILAKEKLHVSGFAFNTTYNYDHIKTGKSIKIKDLLPSLQIKDENKFKDALYEYVEEYLTSIRKYTFPEEMSDSFFLEENKIKYALTTLFIDAGFTDFENITKYVKMRTEFLKSNLINYNREWRNIGEFPGVKNAEILFRMHESIDAYETPDRLEVKIQRTNESGKVEEMYLPSICFGIAWDKAYIYTIQNLPHHKNEDTPLQKEVMRARYKLNKNIPQEEQDVEPLGMISATVLVAFLDSINIEKFQVNNFLPIRYNAKYEANIYKSKGDQEKLDELKDKQQRIQTNLTEKFLKTFLRISEQTGKISLFSDLEESHTIFKNTPNLNAKPEVISEMLIDIYDKTQQASLDLKNEL